LQIVYLSDPMFQASMKPYTFPDSPDGDWLPSPYSLFEEQAPSPAQIRLLCEEIQAGWDEREKVLRRLRAELACELGVCRNF
jgi:hypothetical protein